MVIETTTQNFIIYVNDKNQIRTAKINLLLKDNRYHNFQFTIRERHLICGIILNGKPLKGDYLKLFPFKPIEKYLFEFSNIHFIIPNGEYTTENTFYDFDIDGNGFGDVEYPIVQLLPYSGYVQKMKDKFEFVLKQNENAFNYTPQNNKYNLFTSSLEGDLFQVDAVIDFNEVDGTAIWDIQEDIDNGINDGFPNYRLYLQHTSGLEEPSPIFNTGSENGTIKILNVTNDSETAFLMFYNVPVEFVGGAVDIKASTDNGLTYGTIPYGFGGVVYNNSMINHELGDNVTHVYIERDGVTISNIFQVN